MHLMSRLRIRSRFMLVVVIYLLALTIQVGLVSPAAAATLSPSACPPNCTFVVNSFVDSPHLIPIVPGVCQDQETLAQCSLRAAIEEASLPPLISTIITVPAGTYNLTLGTLNLTANTININGAGFNVTTIYRPTGHGASR